MKSTIDHQRSQSNCSIKTGNETQVQCYVQGNASGAAVALVAVAVAADAAVVSVVVGGYSVPKMVIQLYPIRRFLRYCSRGSDGGCRCRSKSSVQS